MQENEKLPENAATPPELKQTSPTIRELGKHLAEKQNGQTLYKTKSKSPFFTDTAQQHTINHWRNKGVPVKAILIGGAVISGVIQQIGPYSICMRNEEQDILLFKTGIVAIEGPQVNFEKSAEMTTKPEAEAAA